jgi:citrate synthase
LSEVTRIARVDADDVSVRGHSLCTELIGHTSFSSLLFLLVVGRLPAAPQAAMVDACLVALAEHGLTPSAIAARMTVTGAPESVQGAVAAGLLGVGDVFAGTMEGCAALLDEIVAGADPAELAGSRRAARSPVPGFGHPQHKPDDPRAARLLALADAHGVSGRHVAALRSLSVAVDGAWGRHLTINVTGAIAAILRDCDVPAEILRGFAVVSRAAGLVGHVREEQERPAMRALWERAEREIPYEEPERSRK